MNGVDWTDRYPRIVAKAARLKGAAIIDAEVICDADRFQSPAQPDRCHS
jgi:ATP-dependent DNA ligase